MSYKELREQNKLVLYCCGVVQYRSLFFRINSLLYIHYSLAWKSLLSIIYLPADVVYGDVSKLLVHGRLAFLTGVGTEGGLGMFVCHVDLNLTGPFVFCCQKKEKSLIPHTNN